MKKPVNANRYTKFLLYLAVVVLINIAATTFFFRADLTANKVYSLSPASRDVVATLSEPLTVKVFFTGNLPAPYNNIERYLHDLLQEYAIAGNRFFNYQFYDVSSEGNEKARENQDRAKDYGIPSLQIQNIEQDEVKFQTAYMGMVLIHGDLIERIPAITSTEGVEYQITSTIRKMNNKISALLSLENKMEVKLFLSSSLQMVGPYMNLTGLPELPQRIERVVEKLNEKNYNRLTFSHLDPSVSSAYEQEAQRHRVLALKWDAFADRQGKTIPADKGYAGIVVAYNEATEEIPLIKVLRLPIFGTQYTLTEMEALEEHINDTVENIININEEIGYLADHGSPTLQGASAMPGQPQGDSLANLHKLLSEEYTVEQISLKEGGIPEGLSTLIVAGPREGFSDYELFQIDQYLMKGRNLAIFMDTLEESMTAPQQNRTMGQGQHRPLNTGLEKLLDHYGLNVRQSYILDENSYKQQIPRAFGGGERPVYFAPIIKNEFISKDAAYMKNIKGLVMLKASPVAVDAEKIKGADLKAHKLFSSSPQAWEMSGRIDLNPMFLQPPQREEDFQQFAMAYMVSGEFPSYFADKSIPVMEQAPVEARDVETENAESETGVDMSQIESEAAIIRKGKPGKIFLIGTSEILKDNVIDAEGRQPNAQFVMNTIDYLNNREDYAVMRSKAQRFNPLRDMPPVTKTAIKTVNILGLPVLVVAAGFVVWFRRSARKRMIQQIFSK
jgi:ABC-type uncharacterized transport system involved in gliding motility auxiliary subunit